MCTFPGGVTNLPPPLPSPPVSVLAPRRTGSRREETYMLPRFCWVHVYVIYWVHVCLLSPLLWGRNAQLLIVISHFQDNHFHIQHKPNQTQINKPGADAAMTEQLHEERPEGMNLPEMLRRGFLRLTS